MLKSYVILQVLCIVCEELESVLEVYEDSLNKLEKENKELKIKNDLLSDELEQAKAVINKKWDEYLKKKELSE